MFNRCEISNLVPNVRPRQLTISELKKRWDDGEIKLPPLQRRFTYSDTQKCNVIASILVGLSIDSFSVVLDEDPAIWWLCDGNHRLRSILDFINNKFPLDIQGGKDKNLLVSFFKTDKFEKEYNKKLFKDLPKDVQNYISQSLITIMEASCDDDKRLELIDAIIRSKNTCSSPMSEDKLGLNTYLLNYYMNHGTDIRTDSYVYFLDNYKFFSKGIESLDDSQKNEILNSPVISDLIHILFSSLVQDSDVEKFVHNIVKLDERVPSNYCNKVGSLASQKGNAIRGWVKHLILCAYLLTVLKDSSTVDEKDVLYNLNFWDRPWKIGENGKLEPKESLKESARNCWKIILLNYSDKVNFNKISIPDFYRTHSTQVGATKKLVRTHITLNKTLQKKGELKGSFGRDYYSRFLSFFLKGTV